MVKKCLPALLLAFFIMGFFIVPAVFAVGDIYDVVDITDPRAIENIKNNIKSIEVETLVNEDGFKEFRCVDYWCSSTKATSNALVYHTTKLKAWIGTKGQANYCYGEFDATKFADLSKVKPGQTVYTYVTFTLDNFVEAFQAQNPSLTYQDVKDAFDVNDILHVGASVGIFKFGTQVDSIEELSEVSSKAGFYGLGAYASEIATRWRDIPIREPLRPDFSPTPEGSDQWKPEYVDPKVCAKTYTYKADQTSITFPVTVRNTGVKAGETDLKAVWFGHGEDPVVGWTGTSPVWQADKIFTLEPNGSSTSDVNVDLSNVPANSNGILVFKCNVDGNTPALEQNQTNNCMFIKLVKEGVDIKADLTDGPITYWIESGETADINVALLVKRNDEGTTPVNVDVIYSGPFGSVNKQTTLEGYKVGESIACYDIGFNISQPGTYTINASAWPIGLSDTNPSDNTDQTTVIVKLKEQNDAHKVNPDDQTRVNLRS